MSNAELANKVIVILGPTASGKSDLAIRIAKKYNGEIISADSRQIYKYMPIGTGRVPKDKNPKSEIRNPKQIQNPKSKDLFFSGGVRHYLLDFINPKQEYNVSHFKKDTEKIIKDILGRGKLPIICGGTGFWISALTDNKIFPEVKPDKDLRKRLEKESAEKLFAKLKKLDAERASVIDKYNKIRLIRALEICKAIGRVPKLVISNSRQEKNLNYKLPITNYQFIQIGIDIPKEKLYQNIKARLEKRFKAGLIKEVENLRKIYKLSWKKIQSFGLAYYWIPLYLKKKLSKEELFEKIYQAERDYSKRQMTWFKKDGRIFWIKNNQIIIPAINNFLGK
ncbi:MAG: tRNA (adenosine(37)-N6)-dimethylallyltransferase MiaA [Candidatus Moranbacteria bacterium]|nr:tRNA (adenosine(37)-N6)-dimethylallyltransferase MiaA [Candidatus Moranbacteria bacterium]